MPGLSPYQNKNIFCPEESTMKMWKKLRCIVKELVWNGGGNGAE
jgi:hypothetical protein